MADLEMKAAEVLAGQLTTIGHPMKPDWLLATANDLVEWCKGGIFGGRPWMPAEQAGALVKEARMTLGDWQKAGGTTALLSLFRAMFPSSRESDPAWAPLSYEQTVAKGLIRPPCETCDDSLYVGAVPELRYCMACPGGRHAAKWEGEQGLRRLNHPVLPRPRPTRDFAVPTRISPEQMARALEDEQRRRQEQFQRVGVD
jgi:hypothetical protein